MSLLLAWVLVQGGSESVVASICVPEEGAGEVDEDDLPPPSEEPGFAPEEIPDDGSDESPETDDIACALCDEGPSAFASARLHSAEAHPGETLLEPSSPPPRR